MHPDADCSFQTVLEAAKVTLKVGRFQRPVACGQIVLKFITPLTELAALAPSNLESLTKIEGEKNDNQS